MLVVPENVQTGSPPFLKCGLAANAAVAASATAAVTATMTNKSVSSVLSPGLAFMPWGPAVAGQSHVSAAAAASPVQTPSRCPNEPGGRARGGLRLRGMRSVRTGPTRTRLTLASALNHTRRAAGHLRQPEHRNRTASSARFRRAARQETGKTTFDEVHRITVCTKLRIANAPTGTQPGLHARVADGIVESDECHIEASGALRRAA